jgi:hypothetical protein
MNKKIVWIGRALSVLVVLPFVMSATMKFLKPPEVIEGMNHLGIPMNLLTGLGILEVTCFVIYLIPQTAVLGAILLTGYLGGAILTHLRVGEPPFIQIAMGLIVWLGIYLRDPRLHKVLPLRK